MICKQCGCEFNVGTFCPECGTKCTESESNYGNNTENNYSPTISKQESKNDMASPQEDSKKKRQPKHGLVALLCGIFGWLLTFTVICPFVLEIIALVNGIKALKNNEQYKKCAAVGIVFAVVFYVLIIWALAYSLLYL